MVSYKLEKKLMNNKLYVGLFLSLDYKIYALTACCKNLSRHLMTLQSEGVSTMRNIDPETMSILLYKDYFLIKGSYSALDSD